MTMNELPENAILVHIGNITFFVIAAVAVLGILTACLFIAANIRYREYKLLKMTSPNLNLVILSGAILSSITVILVGSPAWLSGRPSSHEISVICMLKHTGVWLGSISFTLLFVPIAAKTWRVHRIFSDAAVKGRVIKDDKLLCFVAMFAVFDVAFLAVWFGVDTPKCRTVESSILPGFTSYAMLPDEAKDGKPTTGISSDVTELQLSCISKLTPMWISILCAYKGIILYYIVYVAWATRYVTFPSMKDAGGLIIGIFVTLACFCIGAPLVVTMGRWPNVQYVIFSLVVFIPLFTVMMLHFLPKLLLIRRHNRDEILTRSFSQYATPKQCEYSDDEVRDLAIQNASLRKEVTEKHRRYKAVVEQLRLTKAKLFKLTVVASGPGETFPSDENMRSGYTESTGDLAETDCKARALTVKTLETSKNLEVSVESSSTSQQADEETSPSDSTQESTNSTNSRSSDATSKQTDTDDVSQTVENDTFPDKRDRHVSFDRNVSLQAPSDSRFPPTHRPMLVNGNLQASNGPIFPKPMVPVMGWKSWEYYTRGTGYLRYKTAILGQANGQNPSTTRYPVTQPSNPHCPQNGQQFFKSTSKINGKNGASVPVEMSALNRSKSNTTGGDLRYFSTSASSRPPSTSTDATSSNDGTVSTKQVSCTKWRNIDKVQQPDNRRDDCNMMDTPSITSAFSIVSAAGRKPNSSTVDSGFSTKIRFPRVDDIGITYEDDYSSGSDSDEYNTATSMDSITCELFPPLTPRYRHYLRRYDEMQARYLANQRKSRSQVYHKKSLASEKSEGYCSGNEALCDSPAKTTFNGRRLKNESASQNYAIYDSKGRLVTRTSRKFDNTYFYDSTTSSDTDSESDWTNSATLRQCWQRAAQASQRPMLKPGPPTYPQSRKEGIFV